MIKAYHAGYVKYDTETVKRRGDYCVIEMTIDSMSHIKLMVIGKDGLVSAHLLETITEITGFHRYTAADGKHLGAGELKALSTKDPKGMLEGLAKQINFNYHIMAKAFGEGLLQLTE